VSDSLNNGISAIDVANSAGQSISDLLIQMKGKAVAAADSSLDTASRQALNSDFQALLGQITNIVNNASFNGTNLINGSTTSITALASANATNKITVAGQNMTLSGTIDTVAKAGSVSTQAKASAMVSTIDTSIQNVDAALANLGSGEQKFSIQNTFVSQLVNSLNTGIGNLVDANMATESANLQSLQVKQQLGVQALSIANSQPQIILSLFH